MEHAGGPARGSGRKHHSLHALGRVPTKRGYAECELPDPNYMIQRMGVTVARWRRPVLDAFLTVGPPLLLLSFLIVIDDRVREQLTLRVAPDRAMLTLVSAGSTFRSLAAVLVEAGRDQSLAHAPMLIFAMA